METRGAFKRLWHLIALDKQEVGSIYFYAVLSGLLQLSVPIGVQAIIGFVLGASMVTSIYVLIVLVVLGVLTVGIMQVNQMKIIEKIQQKIFTRYAFDFAEKTVQLDLLKADNYYLPEKINRFFDTLNVQKGLSKLLLDVPVATIQILFSLLLLSLYHPIFILFSVLLVTLLVVILRLTSRRGLNTSMEESSHKYATVEWLQEMARVVTSFKFSQGTHLNLQKTDSKVVDYLNARTKHFKVLLFQYKVLVYFKAIITAAMLIVGTYLLLEQQLNLGEFIAAEIVILTVIAAVEKLIKNLDSVYDVLTGLEKLASFSESPLEKDGSLVFQDNHKGIAIEMMDYSFAYPDATNTLKDITLSIPANSLVCIVGKESSGKSTLLKALSGHYRHFEGSVLINNIPINNYQLESLRKQIGIYLSEQEIFKGTLWENISMGRQEITPQHIEAMAEEIGLKHFLQRWPSGFETVIDPIGKRLSSTLKKNIILLRAFANSPKLLLLEEPWQGLEDIPKHNLIQYLLNKPRNQTIIIASNDEHFAASCDYQIQLINGVATTIKN
jgi:ATP-binding cassette, subfamily B, bacterial